MGAARTGKTSLITQFLYSRFSPKYKRTVEEMHQGAFSISGVNLTLDILDTSGANEVNKWTLFGYNRFFVASYTVRCKMWLKQNLWGCMMQLASNIVSKKKITNALLEML